MKKKIIILIFVFSIILLIHTSNPINAEHALLHPKPPITQEQLVEEVNSYTISEKITIYTDKLEYFENEIVSVTGIYDTDSMPGVFFWILHHPRDIVQVKIIPQSDGIFNTTINISNLQDLGLYTIGAVYNGETAKTTFTYSSYPLTIQTDKQNYYIDESIIVNGSIGEIDWDNDTTIIYHVERGGIILQTGDSNSLQNDGTFEFIIDTSTWDTDTGTHSLEVTIQNSTVIIGIDYSNTPNMEPETLYEMNIEQYEILDEYDVKLDEYDVTLDEYDVTLDEYETIIDNQQSILDVIVSFLENLGFIFTEPIQPKVINSASTELKCGAGTYLSREACIIIDDTSLCKAGTELINGYCKVL